MKASELIEKLQKFKEENGDIEVVLNQDGIPYDEVTYVNNKRDEALTRMADMDKGNIPFEQEEYMFLKVKSCLYMSYAHLLSYRHRDKIIKAKEEYYKNKLSKNPKV